ncbi:MAG TPA: PEP/pyruvate-binding domain-containing protein [Acidothermaceae bacterium]
MSLGELIHAGIEVPNGFAVTASAFEAFRDQGTLRDDLKHIVRSVDPSRSSVLEAAHAAASGLVAATPIPHDVVDQIVAAYGELCDLTGDEALPVAVRSSGISEDGAVTSFAGQQETYLWVVGARDVIDRVRACWASLYTPQAIAYRSQLPEEVAFEATLISVGVQAMVDAEVAGVAFTVSPRTGDRSVMAINASWGLGQAVVSGEVTPDEYWLSKVGLEVTSSTIAHKTMQCLPSRTGQGVITVPVPDDQQDVACLAPESIRELAEIAIRVEQHYGCPQDIEWARARATSAGPARIVLLQSRPETSWKKRQAESRAKTGSSSAASYLSVIRNAGAGVRKA